MNLYEQIVSFYPELNPTDFTPFGFIDLRDDSDGKGAYIYQWNYEKPIPDGLTLGKPTA